MRALSDRSDSSQRNPGFHDRFPLYTNTGVLIFRFARKGFFGAAQFGGQE
jgi:hypothetical protein